MIKIYDIYGKEHRIRKNSITHVYSTGQYKKNCHSINGSHSQWEDETYGTHVCGHGFSIPVRESISETMAYLKI